MPSCWTGAASSTPPTARASPAIPRCSTVWSRSPEQTVTLPEQSAMSDAIAIIRDEHRSFAAVLQGLTWLVTEIRERRLQPDFELFAAMLAYIRAFPEKLHHPKEDAYVYPRLRQRDPGIAPVLDELEAEHARGRDFIVELA